jgi:hypothetical protein
MCLSIGNKMHVRFLPPQNSTIPISSDILPIDSVATRLTKVPFSHFTSGIIKLVLVFFEEYSFTSKIFLEMATAAKVVNSFPGYIDSRRFNFMCTKSWNNSCPKQFPVFEVLIVILPSTVSVQCGPPCLVSRLKLLMYLPYSIHVKFLAHPIFHYLISRI